MKVTKVDKTVRFADLKFGDVVRAEDDTTDPITYGVVTLALAGEKCITWLGRGVMARGFVDSERFKVVDAELIIRGDGDGDGGGRDS